MTGPNVLIGIGATKAGTSWVHRYLSDHPECHLRGIKELHYFDVLDIREGPDLRNEHVMRLAQLKARQAKPPHVEAVIRDHEDWLRRFDGDTVVDTAYSAYLRDGVGTRKLVADITPAYSIMSGKGWRHMVRAEPDARFLYLLRDPVDRLWSHVRMAAHRQAVKQERADDQAFIQKRSLFLMDKAITGNRPVMTERGDYKRALRRLARFVDPQNYLVLFYEDLFEGATVDRLCDFLGITRVAANTEKRIHAGPSAQMEPELRERASKYLNSQYQAVSEIMGDLPDLWHINREVV